MNIDHIREDIPILRKTNYLNTAASGPVLRPVKDAVETRWDNWERGEPVELPDTRGEVGKLLHCSRDNIALIHRASQGINLVSDLIKPKNGQNIVLTDLSYPSSVYPWLKHREKGVEIRLVHNSNGLITLDDYKRAIDNNTCLVNLNRVEWSSGLRNNVKEITKIAHEHGSIVLDDAFQAVGVLDVDPVKDGVDFLVFGGEKWMCCLARAAALYVATDVIDQYQPSFRFYWRVYEDFTWDQAPWGKPEHDNIKSWDRPVVTTAEKFDPGCVGEDAQMGFQESLRYINELDITNVQERDLKLSGYLIEGLKDLGVKIITPVEDYSRAGIVTYSLGTYELNQLSYNAFKQAGIVVSHRYVGGVGGIRISPHFFNTEVNIDEALQVQKIILKCSL